MTESGYDDSKDAHKFLFLYWKSDTTIEISMLKLKFRYRNRNQNSDKATNIEIPILKPNSKFRFDIGINIEILDNPNIKTFTKLHSNFVGISISSKVKKRFLVEIYRIPVPYIYKYIVQSLDLTSIPDTADFLSVSRILLSKNGCAKFKDCLQSFSYKVNQPVAP
jgi:hypothetical protein